MLSWCNTTQRGSRNADHEAARALIDYAAGHLGIHRFIAHCDAENRASSRVMEKLGMRRVSCTGGRKNRASDEERQELMYEVGY